MRTEIDPYWLTLTLRGFDEDPPGDDDGSNNDDDSDDDDDDNGDDDDSSGSSDDTERLKSALRKERKARREAEKTARSLKKFKDEKDTSDQDELSKAKRLAEEAGGKATKLANRLRDASVDNAITKAAMKLNFVDLDDAIRLIDREEIDVDQDDDDPADIQVDATSVEDALKALAKKKPHLLKRADDGDDEGEPPAPSGSKFSGGKKKSKEDLDEQRLRELYPALRTS